MWRSDKIEICQICIRIVLVFKEGYDTLIHRKFGLTGKETEHGYTPNLEEFQNNVDKKMKYLADCGLLIAVGYAWFFDMPKCGVERYKALAKYTAARYGAYPVAWTLAGELPGYMDGKEEQIRLWNEVESVGAIWHGGMVWSCRALIS